MSKGQLAIFFNSHETGSRKPHDGFKDQQIHAPQVVIFVGYNNDNTDVVPGLVALMFQVLQEGYNF